MSIGPTKILRLRLWTTRKKKKKCSYMTAYCVNHSLKINTTGISSSLLSVISCWSTCAAL